MIKSLRTLFAVWIVLAVYSCALTPQHDDAIVKSPNDQREYAYHVLPNQLRVLLISDPQTDKAAASMNVFAGSGDDPENRQGLAHFLEHMLFLGTKKYPHSGEYQEFINAHGGQHNAYTSLENTNYFFDVDPEFMNEALDRFAQFFIAPLFNEQYVEREMNAVHSEYSSNLTHDGRRELDVIRELVNPKHPFAKFGVGNLSTLSGGNTSTRDDLLDFYRRHYSANQMTLVVLSNKPVAALEQLVRTHFSAIKNRSINKAPITEPLFAKDTLPLKVTIEPKQDTRELTFMFPLPSVREYYHEKPLEYIGNLLGHEGKGSLLSLLKAKGWAESLYSGTAVVYEGGASFELGITLTEEGLKHSDEITGLVFQAIDVVRETGINEWQYEEQQALGNLTFQFQEREDPTHYVMALSTNLQQYPAQDVIRAPFLMTHFDAPLINRYLDALTPENVLITVMAKTSAKPARHSLWYKTPYLVSKIDDREIERWRKKMSDENIKVPEPNPFIPEDLDLKTPATAAGKAVPKPIDFAPGFTLWHQPDVQFRVPRAGMYLNLKTPVANDSPVNAVLTNLYIDLVEDQLKELTYPAALADLDFSIAKNSRGLSVKIQGFNDSQHDLLQQILTVMVNPVYDPERFANRKNELMRMWANQMKATPYQQLLNGVSNVLYTPSWLEPELLAAAKPLELADLQAFTPRLFKKMKAEMLYYGNVTEKEARLAAAAITDHFPQLEHSSYDPVPVSVVKLTGKQRLLREISVDHPDAALLYYLQGASSSYPDRAMISLAAQLLNTDFFQQVRTEKQLGYVVASFANPVYKVPGIAFVIQSPKATSAQLEMAVHDFLMDYADTMQAMSPEQFARQKQALILRILEQPKSLEEQGDRYWQDIVLGYRDLDDREQLAAAIEAIQQADWLAFYDKAFLTVNRKDLIFRTRYSKQPDEHYDERELQRVTNVQRFKAAAEQYVFE